MPGDLSELLGSNSSPQNLATGFASANGPVFSRLGYLLFCDSKARRIMRLEAGKLSVFRENTLARALTFDHQGRLLACEQFGVTRTEKNGSVTAMTNLLHDPRDLVYAIDGSIYFSDDNLSVQQITRRATLRVVSRDSKEPAGVALAPNQQKLYVNDERHRKIWVYEIAGDGALSGGRVFANAAIRGLKTDEGGNVWAAEDHAIAVYDAEGRRRGAIPLPEDPSNCTWGDGFKNLYVTAQTSIYKIETRVNGTRTY